MSRSHRRRERQTPAVHRHRSVRHPVPALRHPQRHRHGRPQRRSHRPAHPRRPRTDHRSHRRDETELEAKWLQAHPAILGGLLDLAAKVHHRLPTIRVDRLPRMADYAKVLACIDEIHHTEGLQRYRERATHLVADSVAADPFIAAMQERDYTCTNATAATILAAVTPAQDRRGARLAEESPRGHHSANPARPHAAGAGMARRERPRAE